MELLMKDMDKRIDELKQFQFDKEWKEQWDAHYERSQKALLDVKVSKPQSQTRCW